MDNWVDFKVIQIIVMVIMKLMLILAVMKTLEKIYERLEMIWRCVIDAMVEV